MAIIVNTNMAALKTQNNLNKATTSLNTTLERLSTGMKINSSKDDAAGMFVATKLTQQINGSKVAQSNVATGTNVLNTVESDIGVILDNLSRIRDLTVQASNGVYDTDSQKAMSDEVKARMEEITRISKASNFNGLSLLDGSLSTKGMRLQVGANSDAAANCITVDQSIFADLSADGTTLNLDSANIETVFQSATAAANYIGTVDTAIATLSTSRSQIGAFQNRLQAASDSLVTTIENTTAAKSTIMDADIAQESAEFTKQQILQQTSAALLVQANQLPALALNLIAG